MPNLDPKLPDRFKFTDPSAFSAYMEKEKKNMRTGWVRTTKGDSNLDTLKSVVNGPEAEVADDVGSGKETQIAATTSSSPTSVETGSDWLNQLLSNYNDQAALSAQQQREFNHREAELDRQWQEMMSNTAHQREIADLEAAGINKLLTVDGGSGASTPSGSAASAAQQQVSDAGVSGIVQIFTQSMRDVQSVQDRILNQLQFDKSLSFEEKKHLEELAFKNKQMWVNFAENMFSTVVGGVTSAARTVAMS